MVSAGPGSGAGGPRGDVGAAYDARAEEYTALLGTPDRLAAVDVARVRRWRDATSGPLLDAGCGPAAWAQVLQGADARVVVGVDLSGRFLATARRRCPRLPLLRGSLAALPLRDAAVGGVLAWYSALHTPPAELPQLLGELGRVLRPGGSLLLGFVDGPAGEPFDHAVLTAWTWTTEALAPLLDAAGLAVVEHEQRRDPGQRPHGALVARRRT